MHRDAWRAECIAAVGWDEDREVQIYPLNSTEYVPYEYDSREEAEKAYDRLVREWAVHCA